MLLCCFQIELNRSTDIQFAISEEHTNSLVHPDNREMFCMAMFEALYPRPFVSRTVMRSSSLHTLPYRKSNVAWVCPPSGGRRVASRRRWQLGASANAGDAPEPTDDRDLNEVRTPGIAHSSCLQVPQHPQFAAGFTEDPCAGVVYELQECALEAR